MRIFVATIFIFFTLVSSVSAAEPAGDGNIQRPAGIGNQTVIPSSSGTSITLANPLKGADCSRGNGNCLESFLRNILAFVIKIGSIVVILMLVFTGYKFVAAQGEPGKITEAREMLLWTVVGALILLGSQAIALGIEKTVQALSVGK